MSELEPFWRAIEEDRKDFLRVGIFADFLEEQNHPFAAGMRWLFDCRKRPARAESRNPDVAAWWKWMAEAKRNHGVHHVPMKIIRQRERFYVSMRNAYKGFCTAFNKSDMATDVTRKCLFHLVST